VPDGWHDGFSQSAGVAAAGISNRDGFAIYVSIEGGPAKEVARSTEWMGVAEGTLAGDDRVGLSADGSLLAIQHSEHGDLTHPSLRVIDPRTGAVLAERGDGSQAVSATGWSPVPGDQRVAVAHEPEDRLRPAVWDLATMRWLDVAVDLPGDVMPVDWWPDGATMLLRHAFEGRHELYRASATGGELERIDTPAGTIEDARVRPDGSVWFLQSDGVHGARILDHRGREPVGVLGAAPPDGRSWTSWRYRNDRGQPVHGLTIEPDGEPPWPVIVFVHGGPHWLYEERYFPEALSYADAGFLVAMPNYRGSTGYGRSWRDALTGDPGFTDVDDVTAGLRDLIERGIVDPERAVVGGWSWGGYIADADGEESRAVVRGGRGDPRRGLRSRLPRRSPCAAGARSRLGRRDARGRAGAIPAIEPADVRRPRPGAGVVRDRRQRLAVPVGAGVVVRGGAGGSWRRARDLSVLGRARVVRDR
jgi:dipeptidyl aminopeptidase/acylaminoacyl peptidase